MYPQPVHRTRPFPSFLSVLLVAFAPTLQQAQQTAPQKPFYLHEGDTVVFYGDSITEQRYFTQWVEDYTVTRFPHMQVQFYNAGVGGDRVTGGSGGPIDERLARDVFPLKPSVVVIMLGMNDGSYTHLSPKIESDYRQGYEHILDSIRKNLPAARITLLGPSPYDEVTRPLMFPAGYNSTLTHFAEIDRQLAQKYNATFVDLNAPFVAALKRGKAINPLAVQLFLPDRVHPEPMGHWIMAEALLKGWNAPATISSTTIDAATLKAAETENSQVSDLAQLSDHSGAFRWTQTDNALPLPLDDENAAVHFLRQISNLDDDLDRQILNVRNLKPGRYRVDIDGLFLANFSAADLAKGINLADYGTPMRGQAATVSWLVRDRDDAHYVRLRMFVTQMRTGAPAEPGATDMLKFENVLQKEFYDLVQPHPHTFDVTPVVTSPSASVK